MMAIFELIATFWPPNDQRDRQWWKIGMILGGMFFIIGAILMGLWNLRGGS